MLQENKLINKELTSEFNLSILKLMFVNRGYSDK